MNQTHTTHSGGYGQRSAGGQQGQQASHGQQGQGEQQQHGEQQFGGRRGQQHQHGGQQQGGQPATRQLSGSDQQHQHGGQSPPQQPAGAEFQTRNYLPKEARRTSVTVLNQCLADVTVLETHLKAAHWNVKGENFYQLHELFEELAAMLDEYADEVAERATALGGEALGTARVAARTSNVPPWPPDAYDGQAVLQHVADHLATLDAELYHAITTTSQRDDLDTADLLNEFSRDISKALWFVEAHLQGRGGQPVAGGGV